MQGLFDPLIMGNRTGHPLDPISCPVCTLIEKSFMKSQNKVPLHYMQSPQGSTGNGRYYDNFDILDLRMRKATVSAETGLDVDYRVLNFSNKTQTNKQTD